MNKLQSVLLLALCIVPSCAAPRAADSDIVKLQTGDGMSLSDFLKRGQAVTGKTFVFAAKDAKKIRLIGTVSVERSDYLRFMKTTLRAHGFELRPAGSESDALQVVPMATVGVKGEIVRLTHTDPKIVVSRLRDAAKKDTSRRKLVVVGHVESKSVLLSGSKEQVSAAKDMIAQMDQPAKK